MNDSKKNAWIFDVDGVLSDPQEKRVTREEIFFELEKRLKAGEPVILNTGRSLDFIVTKIATPLKDRLGDSSLLINFFAVAEKGAISLQYDADGNSSTEIDKTILMPEEMTQAVRVLVKNDFSDVAFFDESKRAMISVEMHDGMNLENFAHRQPELNEQLQKIIDRFGLTAEFRIDPSLIATDVEHKIVGKALGARRICEWLQKRGLEPETLFVFGDSRVDAMMAEEFYQRGFNVKFIFVGKKDLLADYTAPFDIEFGNALYEAGTVAFLSPYPPQSLS